MNATHAATLLPATHEATAWMRGRLATLERIAAPTHAADPGAVVLVPLGSRGEPGERSDRECDRCGRYEPPTVPGQPFRFHLVTVRPGPWLLVIGGLCQTCAEAEGVTP